MTAGRHAREHTPDRQLIVVAYHYVRDLPRTKYPRIKGLAIETFGRQLDAFASRYEMVSLAAAMDFLDGRYRPAKDLCLLTFDDGLKEHHADVLPRLVERGLPACFFPATSCVEGEMAAVHKIHFLMAASDLADLLNDLHEALSRRGLPVSPVAPEEIRRCYPWDTIEAGTFKYTLNFVLPAAVREAIVDEMFVTRLGDTGAFARDLYLGWHELREMQAHGMVIGGHSHTHRALSALSRDDQARDVARCADLLHARLLTQPTWPFAYPYGWYNDDTMQVLRDRGFACAFTVEPGPNTMGQPAYELRRFDTVQLLPN